ncbi:tyrosine-type recombinase/integrase [Longilinea arvoryzae]|nr:tyrosine-type recombinase/integrase [Longilinea arvoryzae]
MPSIHEAIEAFKTNVQFRNPNTRRLYHRGIDAFGEFIAANGSLDAPIQSLARDATAAFNGWMARDKGYAAPTQRLYAAVLRAALRYWRANFDGWIRFTREQEQEAARTSLIGELDDAEPRHARLPEDFGNRMLKAALEIPVPAEPHARLDVLRLRALIAVLRASALRIGDALRLTRADLADAAAQNGRLEVKMEKTGLTAHIRLGEATLEFVQTYLAARDDNSPWLFIQHGKSNRRRKNSPAFFRSARRGYGARLSTTSGWRLVQGLAAGAGLDRSAQFTSPHAFRHWHAQRLIDQGVALENVQAVLGHSTPATTRAVYAPEPDRRAIDDAEKKLQE